MPSAAATARRPGRRHRVPRRSAALRYAGNVRGGGSFAAFDPGGAGVGLDGYQGVLFDGSYVLFIPPQDGGGIHGRVLIFGK
ncbi:MAG: hypothetical protein IPK26_11735 [Planctomycetes bacterium]|nr:hypothetical protein [Planctomycetota bacterium]